jgi:casein kinase II subunit beta
MKWLRSRPADVNELDECRIWADNLANHQQNHHVGQDVQKVVPLDQDMADGNDEVEEGEQEDLDMGASGNLNGGGVEHAGGTSMSKTAAHLPSQRRKAKRRVAAGGGTAGDASPGASLVNGADATARSAVRVGDGG